MPEIRLRKLPDRTPVKVTVSLAPDLNQALLEYAEFYGEVYGRKEPVQELIPAILAGFLDGDRTFVRRRRAQAGRPA